jgi:hypothetical protein
MPEAKCPKCGGSIYKNGRAESGRRRYKCRACGHRTTNPFQDTTEALTFPSQIPRSDFYIFTSAQNATPVHKQFLKNLERYAKHKNGALVVIPFRYRNPTSQWSSSNESHEWWAKEVVPHLYNGRFNLNKSLTVLADIKVQPTAESPLTGLESVTGVRSSILGHPKVSLKSIPTLGHMLPKLLASTGAVTVENYSDTKAGKKGEFHHTLGAIVVEVERERFHMRHVLACEDGSFIDLDKEVTAKCIKKARPAKALIQGDTHVDFVDPDVVKATFTDKDSLVKTLKPAHLIWHDVLDFYSRNHHSRNDPIVNLVKHHSGMGDVEAEVKRACDFIKKHTPKGCVSVIVPSNHPEAFARWIKDTDWRSDPQNAEFYLETALAVVRSAKMTDSGASAVDPFSYWAGSILGDDVVILDRDESFFVGGHELSNHGDKGANGARGHIRAFARIGPKTFIGHSHSPGWFEGCKQVGTSSRLRLEYNTGLSSWLHTHGVVYANDKPALINIINGRYRNKAA